MQSIVTDIKYSIFDPAGNITALVESPADAIFQPAIAAKIMQKHPDVEQVGFVTLDAGKDADVKLRMAGGEFCGNATMSSAALFAVRNGLYGDMTVSVRVSGISDSLEVTLSRQNETAFDASVIMPQAFGTDMVEFKSSESEDRPSDRAPVVRMEGIDHIVIEADSDLYAMKDDRAAAEEKIRKWSRALNSDCLGIMFLKDEGNRMQMEMEPLVYVPGADTLFWENSCASGSAAVGMYLSKKAKSRISATLFEPGGTLMVESDYENGETRLFSTTKLSGAYTIKIDISSL